MAMLLEVAEKAGLEGVTEKTILVRNYDKQQLLFLLWFIETMTLLCHIAVESGTIAYG